MNREIKFRVWNKELEEMQEVTSMFWYNKKLNSIGDDFDDEATSIDDIELMQYTGLKDINDVEIYEGHILYGGMEYYMQYGNVLVGIGECFGNEEIKDEDNMVYGVYIEVESEKFGISQNIASVYEIVGNIYDNKDLLAEVTNE